MNAQRIALFLAAACLWSTASAQELRLGRAGTSLLLGEVSFTYRGGTKNEDRTRGDLPTETDLLVGPTYGFFVIDGLMLGLLLDYHRATVEEGTTENITNGFRIGVRPAYYLPLLHNRALNLYFRGLLGFGLDTTEARTDNSVTNFSKSGFAGGVGAGIAFGFGAIWGGVLQLGIDYTYEGLSSDAGSAGPKLSEDKHIVTIGSSIGIYF